MSAGPGLTGERHFEFSTEYYRKGDDRRTIAYGKRRDEVLAMLQRAHGTGIDWEDVWVVRERQLNLGLGSAWVRVARRYDEYGERVYPDPAKAVRRGVNQRKGQDGRA